MYFIEYKWYISWKNHCHHSIHVNTTKYKIDKCVDINMISGMCTYWYKCNFIQFRLPQKNMYIDKNWL